MLSYRLKCKKNTESINPNVLKTTNGKTMIYVLYVLYVAAKNQNLLKSNKQKDY